MTESPTSCQNKWEIVSKFVVFSQCPNIKHVCYYVDLIFQFCFETHELPKDGILQEVISIWMQLCSVAHFSVIKISIGAISCTADCTADCTHSNFDDREMGNWTELHSYWNYFLQNTIFSSVSILSSFADTKYVVCLKQTFSSTVIKSSSF